MDRETDRAECQIFDMAFASFITLFSIERIGLRDSPNTLVQVIEHLPRLPIYLSRWMKFSFSYCSKMILHTNKLSFNNNVIILCVKQLFIPML